MASASIGPRHCAKPIWQSRVLPMRLLPNSIPIARSLPAGYRPARPGRGMGVGGKMNRFKWLRELFTPWLARINPGSALHRPIHDEIERAAGRRIRILIVPFGSRPTTRPNALLLRGTIKRAFGRSADVISAAEPFVWKNEESFDLYMQQRARAQQLLKDNRCDVLVVRQPAPGGLPLLRVMSTEGKRQTYSRIEKFDLPVFFSHRHRRLFAARLFVAASQAAHMDEDLHATILKKFVERLNPLPDAPPVIRGWTLANCAFLHRLLGEAGSTGDLKKAVQIYQDALKEFSRERDPLVWAGIQDDLGTVLRIVGEKEHDTSTLQQAVAAFNEALSERTHERVPMQWAATQNNLALTLVNLGIQKQTVRLEEAMTAFQAALTEWTRERVPLDWARIQEDLGRLLTRLGDQSKDTARWEQAVAAFRAALEERRRDRVRTQWAATQRSLGNTLLRLGERRKGTSELHEAVTAFRAALQERNWDAVPRQWAATQYSLGAALTAIGVREADRQYLQQAVAAYREALVVRTRNGMPVEWATTQNDLGVALLRLAQLENDPVILKEAIAAFEATLLERTREGRLLHWAATQSNLAAALLRLADSETGNRCRERAVAAYRLAAEAYEEASAGPAARIARANLMAAEAQLKAAVEG